MEFTRRRFIATAGLAAFAGCTSGVNGGPEGSSTTAAGSNPNGSTSNSDKAVPTAKEPLTLSMDPGEFESLAVSGRPSKDGIPSVDDPSFVDPDDASFLDPGDPVFGVRLNGDTKAYPQKILIQHEIVNDRLGDLPVAFGTVNHATRRWVAAGNVLFRRSQIRFTHDFPWQRRRSGTVTRSSRRPAALSAGVGSDASIYTTIIRSTGNP